MKCIVNFSTSATIRVSDKEAERKVKAGTHGYMPKHIYKWERAAKASKRKRL